MAGPERPFAMGRAATLTLILALGLGGSAAQGERTTGCAMPGTRLLADAPLDASGPGSSLLSIDPLDGATNRLPIHAPRTITPLMQPGFVIAADASGQDHLVRLHDGQTAPVSGAIVTAVETTLSFTTLFHSPRWIALRAHDGAGSRLRIVDRNLDRVVVDTVFPRRIEIVATAASPGGRFVAHLQANNVVSELTLLDAETGVRNDLRIPHDAPLAAYALALTFSPDASCLAVSMIREGGLPESWMVDPRQPGLAARPIADVFVLAWVVFPGEPDQV